MRLITGLLAACLILWVSSSVTRTLIVPRALRSRLTTMILAAVRLPLLGLTWCVREYEQRDALLAWVGPLSLVAMLLTWLAGYFVAYGLLLFALADLPIATAFREAGSSLFTLGFASNARTSLTAVDFLAAATGPVVIGLLIGYLPTFYGAYNRREQEVTLLNSRSGLPAWGPEILARHAQVGILGSLDDLFAGWERWASDVSESHSNYPVLIYFRSPRPYASWLTAVVAVLDAAAMHLAFNPSLPQGHARLALRSGFVCLQQIATAQNIRFDADPDPDGDIVLTYEEFLGAVSHLHESGYPMERAAEDAWPHFRGWRRNYEAIAHRLAWEVDAVPAPWSGPRRHGGTELRVTSPLDRKPSTRRPGSASPARADAGDPAP